MLSGGPQWTQVPHRWTGGLIGFLRFTFHLINSSNSLKIRNNRKICVTVFIPNFVSFLYFFYKFFHCTLKAPAPNDVFCVVESCGPVG